MDQAPGLYVTKQHSHAAWYAAARQYSGCTLTCFAHNSQHRFFTLSAALSAAVLRVFIQAFKARLKKDLNTTATALLLPENKALLTRVLRVRAANVQCMY
jgi:hypothetical protein